MNWNLSIFIELLNSALLFDAQTDNILSSILFSLNTAIEVDAWCAHGLLLLS